MGQYGTAELTKAAQALASLVNTGVKIVGGNYLAIFELAGPLGIVKGINLTEAKAELLDLEPLERQAVEQAFAMGLQIANKTIEQKIADSAALLNEAVDIVEEGLQVVTDAKALVVKVKALVGV